MIILDTNIVISYIQGERKITNWIDGERTRGMHFGISTLSVTELFCYPRMNEEERVAIEQWLTVVLAIPVDIVIARFAADIRKDYALTTIDSTIAATALVHNAQLATRDLQFQKIKEIEILAP